MPNALMFRKSYRIPAERALLKEIPCTENIEKKRMQIKANEKMTKSRLYQETRFNKQRKETARFNIGDKVVVQDTQKAGSSKLGSKYLGPYIILKVIDNDRCMLKRLNKKSQVTKVAAHEQLRYWLESKDPHLTKA